MVGALGCRGNDLLWCQVCHVLVEHKAHSMLANHHSSKPWDRPWSSTCPRNAGKSMHPQWNFLHVSFSIDSGEKPLVDFVFRWGTPQRSDTSGRHAVVLIKRLSKSNQGNRPHRPLLQSFASFLKSKSAVGSDFWGLKVWLLMWLLNTSDRSELRGQCSHRPHLFL